MIVRHLAEKLKVAATQYPVVTVTGPRQSGKTTLVRAVFADHEYASLEDPELRAFALEDPRGFLGRFAGPVILDEVQRAPDLFSYVQCLVDERDRPGDFILTGSQNFLLMQRISQSLAGRCAVLHLLPFSRAELAAEALADLSEIERPRPRGGPPARDLFRMMFRGFYPRIHDKELSPQGWLANYYQTYVERDVRELLNVGDAEAFGRFVRLCAGRCAQLLNLSSLATDCGVSHATARRWLSVLEASFLVTLLRPYHASFTKRLVKSPKLYFLDTGLLCYLLRIRCPEDLLTHAARGAVFESWAVSEALKSRLNRGAEADLFFWRDSGGHEIDLVVDRGRDRVAVEVKSGQTVTEDFFRGIEYWRTLPGQARSPAALVYAGQESYVRKGISVVSWARWP